MHFQLKPPSIPHIRAKWVMLNRLPFQIFGLSQGSLHQNLNLVDHDKLVTTTLSNGLTEAIHLIIADETSDTVDSEKYEVATGCPKEGIVKFTVALGVLSGYQLLMKPVVYTVKQKTESMSQESGEVTKKSLTIVAQPPQTSVADGELSETTSISNPT